MANPRSEEWYKARSMAEFERAFDEIVKAKLLEQKPGGAPGQMLLTEKGWRIFGYLCAAFGRVYEQSPAALSGQFHINGNTWEPNFTPDDFVVLSRFAFDTAVWKSLNPGMQPFDGQHR